MNLAGRLQGDRTLENLIELSAEGASIMRNSQAKGQRLFFETFDMYRLFAFADSLFFYNKTYA